jgi:uncharacterized metal-binding protein YceD (DUF177 family)
VTPELHRPVAADRIGRQTQEQVVEASAAECQAIGARLRIPAVLSLVCRFDLRRGPAEGLAIEAEGQLAARVVRECVVSLEPFEMDVAETFALRFVPRGSEIEDDDPELIDEVPFDNGAIDLGEAAVEQLALALDPFPRDPAAVVPALDEAETPTSPLAAALVARKPR